VPVAAHYLGTGFGGGLFKLASQNSLGSGTLFGVRASTEIAIFGNDRHPPSAIEREGLDGPAEARSFCALPVGWATAFCGRCRTAATLLLAIVKHDGEQ